MNALAIVAALVFGPQALAQQPIPPTRADLARAYLRFETKFAILAPTDPRIPEINRAFDGLTVDFFAGNSLGAIQRLDALSTYIDADEERRDVEAIVSAIHVSMRPRVLSMTGPTDFTAEVRLTHPLPDGLETDSVGFVVGDSRSRSGSGFGHEDKRFIRLPKLAPGVRTRIDLGRWTPPANSRSTDIQTLPWGLGVNEQYETIFIAMSWAQPSLDALRDQVLSSLSAVVVDGPPLQQALAACRARARLLSDTESDTNSAQFLADKDVLAESVEPEAREILSGSDPYRRRIGDIWRTIIVGTQELAVRVHAPKVASSDDKLPLVIALHGAGGDENMFFDGYGAGRIKELAERHGFVCVAPRVGMLGLSSDAFDAIVEAMLYDYAIDVKRIHVLGHSLGAAAAFGLATTRSERIASAACLCGGPRSETPKHCAPLLVMAGEIDPLVGAAGLKNSAERLKSAGLTVEYRVVQSYGHTLLVGAKLPEVVTWMLAHSR